MITFSIFQFPTPSDILTNVVNISLYQCLSPMMSIWTFSITTEWKYTNDRLQINLSVEDNLNNKEEDIAATIESLLNSYQYGYTRTIEDMTIPAYNAGFDLIPSNSSPNTGILSSNQLFFILSYLRQNNSALRYTLSFQNDSCNTSKIRVITTSEISPWGIIEGFELDSQAFRIIDSEQYIIIDNYVANKLLSLPIAHPGLANLIYGYNNQASTDFMPGENGNIVVGRIHNSPCGEKLTLRPKDFSYMTAIWGVPGQGKTVLSLSLIIQLWKDKIPTLVIEPSKHEYRALANLFPDDVKVVDDMSKFNILMPPQGVDYLSWSEVVMNLLNIACQLPDDSCLAGYYRKAYLLNATSPTYPEPKVNPRRMLACYDSVMEKEGFGPSNRDFVKAGRSRLESFFTYFNDANWNKTDSPLIEFDINALLETPVIIELSKISTPKMKSAWVYFILQHLYAHIQQRKSETDSLRNLLVLEEAHNILRTNMNPDVLANVANILAEARALQLGVLISDQSPKTLEPSCISMAQNVFSFKIVDEEDRCIIASSTDCDPAKLIKVQKRNCIVRTNFMHETNTVAVISDYANKISEPVVLKDINKLNN